MPLVQRFPALSSPIFVRYLAGGFVSNVGNNVQAWTIAWQVYEITKSSAMVGVLGLVRVIPLLLLALFGGVVADQFDRRKVMILAQSGMAVVALSLFLTTQAGAAHVGLLYGLVALGAVARAFDGPARQSLVPSLVPAEHLPNAIGINAIGWRLSDVLGPLLAGLLLSVPSVAGLRGIAFCYLLNFLTFFAVIGALFTLPPRPSTQARIRSFGEVIGSIREGFVFIRQTPVVRNAMWIDFWATFFSAADALLPAFAGPILNLGPKGYGMLAGSSAMGAFVAAVVMSMIPTIRNQGRWVIGMIACYGLFTIGFGLAPNLWTAMFFLAATGAADMVSTVLRQTIRQLATPDEKRGRMTATSQIFNISGPQLGDFESGILAKVTGERAAVVIGGAACLLVAGWWAKGSALRDYRHGDHQKEGSA